LSIEVRNITKSFGSFKALDEVTLTIPDGQLVALLGPSGSGKSTLLRIIAGLELADPREDSLISLRGQNVTRQTVGERGIGFVFQHYALFRHMSVFENIAFGLRVKPWRERPSRRAIKDKVMQLVNLMQIEGLEKRTPSQLSGGQRQRVALARALATEPKVLLLDEPFGALDAKVRLDLRRWLRRLHDEIHVTSVFVTHDQEEALEVADQIVVMNKGRIEQVGTPEEVFHKPATAFVTEFLGNVNLFHGRVEHGRAVFGSLSVDHPGAGEGSKAILFVRPHEIELTRATTSPSAIRTTITRIQSAGPSVKVELVDDERRPLLAEISHERFASLNLKSGESVYATPRESRVFVDDFVI
jgi:sulfate transport system ATP-binding protein